METLKQRGGYMTDEEMQKIIDTPSNANILVTNNLYYPPEYRLYWRGFWWGWGLGMGFVTTYGVFITTGQIANWMGL